MFRPGQATRLLPLLPSQHRTASAMPTPSPGIYTRPSVTSRLQETEGAKWDEPLTVLDWSHSHTVFRRRAIFHSLKDLGVRGEVGRKPRALNNEIPKQKGECIFTKRYPSQRFKQLWISITQFQKYTTSTEEPETQGKWQWTIGIRSLMLLVWSRAIFLQGNGRPGVRQANLDRTYWKNKGQGCWMFLQTAWVSP